MDDTDLGILAKKRGFVGDGDLVVDWKILKYTGYAGIESSDEYKQQIDATVHVYDGTEELWLGEESLEALINALQEALDAYNHFTNNKEGTSE